MSTPISPVVSGLTQAFSLANMIKRQQFEQQQIQLEQQRMAQQQQYQDDQRQRQNTDLAMRLSAMGARPMTPADELEADSGLGVRFNMARTRMAGPAGQGGLYNLPDRFNRAPGVGVGALAALPQTNTSIIPSVAPSDIRNRVVKAGGQQWVLPSEQDYENREYRRNKLETESAVAKTKATEQAKVDVQRNAFEQNLKTFGRQVDPEVEKLTEGAFKAGQWIMPEHFDDYARTIAVFKQAQIKAQHPTITRSGVVSGQYGQKVYGITDKGEMKFWDVPGVGPKSGGTTPNQDRLADKDAKADAVEKIASEYAQQFDSFGDADKALREAGKSNPFIKENYLKIRQQLPGRAGADKPANDMDKAIKQLLGEDDSTPAAAAAPAPKKSNGQAQPAATPKAAKGKANGDKLRAYAKARGISFKAAVAQAAKEGYDVTGLQ